MKNYLNQLDSIQQNSLADYAANIANNPRIISEAERRILRNDGNLMMRRTLANIIALLRIGGYTDRSQRFTRPVPQHIMLALATLLDIIITDPRMAAIIECDESLRWTKDGLVVFFIDHGFYFAPRSANQSPFSLLLNDLSDAPSVPEALAAFHKISLWHESDSPYVHATADAKMAMAG